MEDVVAIKVVDSHRRAHFFLTWGRVFDAVDARPLIDAMRVASRQFGIAGIREIRVCETLQAAAREPYFYQALLSFSQGRIPRSQAYAKWKAARRKKMERGKEIYYLGSAQKKSA